MGQLFNFRFVPDSFSLGGSKSTFLTIFLKNTHNSTKNGIYARFCQQKRPFYVVKRTSRPKIVCTVSQKGRILHRKSRERRKNENMHQPKTLLLHRKPASGGPFFGSKHGSLRLTHFKKEIPLGRLESAQKVAQNRPTRVKKSSKSTLQSANHYGKTADCEGPCPVETGAPHASRRPLGPPGAPSGPQLRPGGPGSRF